MRLRIVHYSVQPHPPQLDIRSRLRRAPRSFRASFPASNRGRRDEPDFPPRYARAPLRSEPRFYRVRAPAFRAHQESRAPREAAQRRFGPPPPPEHKIPNPERLLRRNRASPAPPPRLTRRRVRSEERRVGKE